MQPYTHLLRIEAVNLANVLSDTQDLSTVRGSGLLMLEAVKAVHSELEKHCQIVETISEGASVGLFGFTPNNGLSAEEIRQKSVAVMEIDDKHRHFTFVSDTVDAEKSGDHFRDCVERLVALNRRRQLSQLSVTPPHWNESALVYPDACFDRLRPATEKVFLPENKIALTSESVIERREHGREKRSQLYHDLGVTPDHLDDDFFTDDLLTLAGGAPNEMVHLDGKIALFYTDGNSFENLQFEHCKSAKLQAEFDKTVRKGREALLSNLLGKMGTCADRQPRWWTKTRKHGRDRVDVRRIETLLWGGDELIFVVPAWTGWELSTFFFEQTKDWRFNYTDINGQPQEIELTHAAGLLFASSRAPIQRLIALAKSLAQLAKNTIKKKCITGRECNLLAYEALESFDHVGSNVAENWEKRLANTGLNPEDLLLPGIHLRDVWKKITALEEAGFPQRQLHMHARDISPRETWKSTLGGFDKPLQVKLKEIPPLLAPFPDKAAWIHLSQLWNYVADVPTL